MKKHFYLFGLLAALALNAPQEALADGMLIPHLPSKPIEPIQRIPNFSIKYHKVTVNIDNQVARTEVDQVFHNSYNRQLEGTYLFPIPEGASMNKFSMDVNGKMTPAELLTAGEARRIYQDIVRQRVDPGLMEYAGHNLYRARVFPIPARGDKRIQLRYEQFLPSKSDTHSYRYILSTEKFSQRPLEKVSVVVNLKSKKALKNIYSPSHSISVQRINDYEARVSYEANQVKPDTDFELIYTTSEDDIGLNLLTYRKGNEDGYFMLLASPKVKWKKQAVMPKTMTFILDTSGSMNGKKIQQAKDALRFNLNQLNPQDRFQLMNFSDTVKLYTKSPIAATPDNIKRAIDSVSGLKATGGTDINSALLQSFKPLRAKDLNMTLFLTDGDPTVGETNFEDILKNVSQANRLNTRLFVFGVGFDVNTPFLDRLAMQNKGSSEYVRPEENIESKVSQLFSRISNPVLSNLKLSYGAVNTYDALPKDLPDFFKGSQLVLTGRYKNAGGTTLTLQGDINQEPKKYSWSTEFSGQNTNYDFIPRLWAQQKIGYLLNEIRIKGNNQELINEVIRLSKAYGIVTEYTSFLVRDDVDLRKPASALQNELSDKVEESRKESKGSYAISQSRNLKKLQQNAPASESNTYYDAEGNQQTVTAVKYVSERAFFYKNGVWKDALPAKGLPVIKVKPYSDLYFALAGDKGLSKILALGEKVEFVHQGHLIVMDDKGDSMLTPALKSKLKL